MGLAGCIQLERTATPTATKERVITINKVIMGIKLKTPQSAINKMLERKAQAVNDAIVEALKMLGTECVKVIRNNGNYTDQTGNLRSSTGFMVVSNGQEVYKSSFEVVEEGYEGSKRGKEIVAEVAKQYPTDNVLVVVAGMKYGIYVERKGYDVLTSGQLFAKKGVKQYVEEMGLTLK